MRGLGVLCWVAPLCPSCRRCRSPRWWVDKQHPCCCWNAPENRPNAVSHTWLWCISSSPAGGCQGGTKKGQDLVKGWAIECATPHSHLSSADVGVLLKCAQLQEHDSLPTTYFVPEKNILVLGAIINFNDGGYSNAETWTVICRFYWYPAQQFMTPRKPVMIV